MEGSNYLPRRSGLLRGFKRSLRRVRPLLISRYGEEAAQRLIRDAMEVYASLIPQIPFIGARSPFLIFLMPTVKCLALYRALQRQGRTVEEAGELIYAMSDIELRAIPALVRRVMAWLWFTPWFKGRARRRALSSQQRQYAGNFVMHYVEGDGKAFDYGIDYLECANVKFLKAQGAGELTPYICATDRLSSEMLGWGLHRSTTLAEGGRRCDFRFTKGGDTSV